MRTDVKSIPTMDYGRYILCLPYSTLLIALILCLQSNSLMSSNAACIAEVRISLNGYGEAYLTPNMFMNGNSAGYTLEVEDSPLADKTMVNCTFRNSSVSIVLTSADNKSTCWSTLYIDDKQEFEVNVKDTLVKCILPLDDIDIEPLIEVVDNCFELSDLKVSFVDALDSTHTATSDTLRTFTRIWTFTDPDGLKKVVTSNIFTSRLDGANIVFPMDTTIYYPNDPTDSTITGLTTYMMLNMFDLCNVMVVDELLGPVIQDCDKNLKYFRERMILDNQTWEVIARDTQTILYRDTTLESIIKPDLAFTNGSHCSADLEIKDFTVTNNGIGVVPDDYKTIKVDGDFQLPGDVLNFMVGDTVIIEYSARDDCFSMLQTVSDTLVASITDSIVVNCPVIIDDVSISLDDQTEKSIWVDRIFSGTVSSCINYSIVGAKVTESCGPEDLIFDKLITFCQEDVGTTVMVRVTAMDSLGNASKDTCMVMVNVGDKNPPMVTCLVMADTIYIDKSDSLATISDPLKYLLASDDTSLKSLTGSGSSIASTGSGFAFMADFITMNSLGPIIGDNQFECQDTGIYKLELTVADSSGNHSTCPIDLTVLDSAGVCTPVMTTGMLLAWGDVPISGALLSYYDNERLISSTQSDDNGSFTYEGNAIDLNRIELLYEDDWLESLTANDLFMLEQILTGSELPNKYESISADIDKNGAINGQDFIALKRILMGEEIELMYEFDSWTFFDANADCVEFMDCMDSDNVINLKAQNQAIAIHGVKSGDIDGDILNELESRNITRLGYDIVNASTNGSLEGDYLIKFNTIDLADYNSLQIEVVVPEHANVEVLSEHVVHRRVDANTFRIIHLNTDPVYRSDIEIILSFGSSQDEIDEILLTSNFESLIFSDYEKSQIVLERSSKLSDDDISKDANSLSMTISPNPSRQMSEIKIEAIDSDQMIQLTIQDELGSVIKSSLYTPQYAKSNTVLLDTDLDKGMYVITIQQGSKVTSQKYIKL